MKFDITQPQFLDFLILGPFWISLVTVVLMLATFNQIRLQKSFHLLGLVLLLGSSIVEGLLLRMSPIWVIHFGNWSPPFGITFVIDGLTVLMTLLISLIALVTGLYALREIPMDHFKVGFLPAFWFLNIGIFGSVMTGDLFNLYVWFEMMLIGSFILIGLGNAKKWLSNKFKYAVLNLTGTLLLLTGIAFVYGLSGTLNMADLSEAFSHASETPTQAMIIGFLFLGLAVKSALFPVFSWLPASYHTTSTTASALMGGLMSKIGVYVMIRLFTLVFPLSHLPVLQNIILVLAGLTMITGVLGAASQYNYRRILSFHIVSQIGYMVFGLAMSTPIALAATLFFMAHNILAKTSLFLTSGVAKHLTETSDIRNMGGLYRQAPTLAVLFLISGLALAGIPPLSGFWGKFLLIQSGFTHHFLVLSVIALVVSMITLYSMLKIWHYAYLSPSKEKSSLVFGKGAYAGLIGPLLFLMFVLLVFSLFPQPIYDYCQWVAQSLFQPEQYIQAILGVH